MVHILRDLIQNAREYKFPIHIPYKELGEEQINMVKKGFGKYKGLNHFFSDLEKKTIKFMYV